MSYMSSRRRDSSDLKASQVKLHSLFFASSASLRQMLLLKTFRHALVPVRKLRRLGLERLDLAAQFFHLLLRLPEVVCHLLVEPALGGGTRSEPQAYRHGRAHSDVSIEQLRERLAR